MEGLYQEIERQFFAGNLIEAQHLGESALKQRKNLDDKDRARLRIQLGRVLLYEGQSDRSAVVLRESVPSGLEKSFQIQRLLFLAMAEVRLQRSAIAEHTLEAASALGPEGELALKLSNIQGIVYLEQGRPSEAQKCLQASLEQAHRQHFSFLESEIALNLGVVALRQERYDDALELFRRAANTAQSIGANLLFQKALANLGRTYYEVGDLSRARQNTEAAEARARRSGVVVDDVHLLIDGGLIQFNEQDVSSAEQSFERAVKLAQSIQNASLELNAQIGLAYMYMQSQPETAASHISQAMRLASLLRDSEEEAETQLLQALLCAQREQFPQAEAILMTLLQRTDAEPSFRWETENTLASLYEISSRPQLAEQWYRHAIDTFHQQRLTLKSVELELPFLVNGSDLYMGYMAHLIRAGRTGEALGLLDTSRAETLAEGLGTGPARTGKTADPRAVAARLHATVLVYCLRPDRSYLWAVTGKEQKFYTLPGSGAILPLVTRHNEAILGAKDLLAQKDSTGRALYDALLAPAERLLPGGDGKTRGGRVVLVADSALSRLNFETLIPPGDRPHYWVEDASVTNARSLRLLAAGGEARRAETKLEPPLEPKLLLIGDPIYAKGEYTPLPHAGTEMAEIAAHFAAAERFVAAREEASPAIYEKSRPGRFRFLHFVAHATASELNPLDSAVILSSKDPGGTGATNKLYASEILKQPLSAELVTLSSCYSSGTRNYAGEGVVGLAWAFLRAGAHSVIGALWDVSDVSTPKLMDTMYTRLLAGDAPDAALRAAKLEMLHSDGVFRKPVYWGAFQLYAGR